VGGGVAPPRWCVSTSPEGHCLSVLGRALAQESKEQRTGKGAACRDRVGATAPSGRNVCYGHGSLEGNLSCFFSTERHHIVEVVQYVIRGAYLEALNTQHCSQLFSKLCSQTFQNYVPHDPFRKLCENIESYMISEKTTAEVQFSVLLLGVICLNIFIQMNWTGPLIDVLLPLFPDYTNDDALCALEVDGELPYPSLLALQYLLAAKAFLVDSTDVYTSLHVIYFV
jgi:hypothetical protein